MDKNHKRLQMVVEKGTIVKIDGLAKRLNVKLAISIPADFLDDHDILPGDPHERPK